MHVTKAIPQKDQTGCKTTYSYFSHNYTKVKILSINYVTLGLCTSLHWNSWMTMRYYLMLLEVLKNKTSVQMPGERIS